MSTLFTALVATIAIVNSQTYDEDCGTSTFTVSGESLSIQLERDSDNSMVKITLTGPSDKWFGMVIGAGDMNGYAITGQEDSTYNLTELSMTTGSPGNDIGASGTRTADNSGSNGVLTLERPYLFNDDSTYFDLTDLLTCQVDTISLAGAVGSSLTFGNHGQSNRVENQVFTRTCDCSSTPATDQPTASPSASTATPTSAPSAPTASPEEASSDDYEICATSELITDVSLTVFRDATNEMVKIEISGSNTAWFGYGFGSPTMIGAYAVTVEGADSDNLGVVQRSLTTKGGSNAPGTTSTGGTISVTTDGSIATGVLEMAYSAGEFDFTDFLNCDVDTIDLIAAKGSTTTMAQHGGTTDDRMGAKTLTRESSCTCGSNNQPTTTASANNIFNGFYVILAVFIASLFN